MNTTLFKHMIDEHNRISYTHFYIFGFKYKHNVYFTFTTKEILPYILKMDTASKGQGHSLRFKPDKAQKLLLLPQAQLLCSEEWFESQVASCEYNRGDIFEKLITEMQGQHWTKDHVPFTEAGDIEIDGIPYQIKFEKATFTNEKTLANLGR